MPNITVTVLRIFSSKYLIRRDVTRNNPTIAGAVCVAVTPAKLKEASSTFRMCWKALEIFKLNIGI
jgi:hypothetical protein